MKCTLSELDLNGILFADFPTDLSLEESRERLELEIEEAYEEAEESFSIEDVDLRPDGTPFRTGRMILINEPTISPFSIFLRNSLKARHELGQLTPQEYKDFVDACYRKRAERFDEKRKNENKQKEQNNAQ